MKIFLSSLMVMLSVNSFAAETAQTRVKDRMELMATTQMDDLIRGEMAAVKAYTQVITTIKDNSEKAKLEMIKKDHENAITKLKKHSTKDVLEDTKSAGAWGAFATAWTGGAKLFGDKAALKALTQGEEHGVTEYKEALNDDNIKAEIKALIKSELLPKQEAHLKTIQTFM